MNDTYNYYELFSLCIAVEACTSNEERNDMYEYIFNHIRAARENYAITNGELLELINEMYAAGHRCAFN